MEAVFGTLDSAFTVEEKTETFMEYHVKLNYFIQNSSFGSVVLVITELLRHDSY